MFLSEETLDDLMYRALEHLSKLPFNIEASRSKKLGKTSEVFGALLQLKNPRARLSKTETKGKPFSALGEFLWYLTGSNDLEFIKHYIPKYEDDVEEDGKIHGGYGPRLFNIRGEYNQIETIITLLKASSSTRRAVIQLFDAGDIQGAKKKDIPCTCTLQFVVRDNKLNMLTSMRSNDAFLGLPHDIFSFTMLQEVIARSIGVDVGIYNHSVGSLHLYENHKDKVAGYLKEGFQSTKSPMPAMPVGDPWPAIKKILETEPAIRKSELNEATELKLDVYWEDLVKLLQFYTYVKNKDNTGIEKVIKSMNDKTYIPYLEHKMENLKKESTK